MDNGEIAKHFVEELEQSSEHVKRDRLYYCRMFLDFAGDRPFSEWNKGLVKSFQRQLEGYQPTTQRKIYGIVKRVFDAAKAVHEAERTRLLSEVNPDDPTAVAEILKAMSLPGPTWDLGKRAAPRVQSADMERPSLSEEEIGAMVAAAKQGLLKPQEAAFLALASVYGLRRGELASIRPEHINYQKKTLFVLTEKGGEQREQLLADEIIPYLEEYGFRESPSPFQMSSIYLGIEHRASLEHRYNGGWHRFRRVLDTSLVDACQGIGQVPGELYAHFFLRWRLSSSMVERYYTKSPLEIDRRVLDVHPVVPLWREVKR